MKPGRTMPTNRVSQSPRGPRTHGSKRSSLNLNVGGVVHAVMLGNYSYVKQHVPCGVPIPEGKIRWGLRTADPLTCPACQVWLVRAKLEGLIP